MSSTDAGLFSAKRATHLVAHTISHKRQNNGRHGSTSDLFQCGRMTSRWYVRNQTFAARSIFKHETVKRSPPGREGKMGERREKESKCLSPRQASAAGSLGGQLLLKRICQRSKKIQQTGGRIGHEERDWNWQRVLASSDTAGSICRSYCLPPRSCTGSSASHLGKFPIQPQGAHGGRCMNTITSPSTSHPEVKYSSSERGRGAFSALGDMRVSPCAAGRQYREDHGVGKNTRLAAHD